MKNSIDITKKEKLGTRLKSENAKKQTKTKAPKIIAIAKSGNKKLCTVEIKIFLSIFPLLF